MTRVNRADSGNYTRPATIEQPAAYVANGEGGNSNAGLWDVVYGSDGKFMVHLFSGNFGRGSSRPYFAMQLYPTARHWAETRWCSEMTGIMGVAVDGKLTLVLDGRRYQIIDAYDPDYEHVKILMPLVEYQSQGTRKVS